MASTVEQGECVAYAFLQCIVSYTAQMRLLTS